MLRGKTTMVDSCANRKRICLLGASLDTGNLGVRALAESSIKCILYRWPNAEVTLLGSGREDGEYRLHLFGRQIRVRILPIRFCKNMFLPNHFWILLFYTLVLKLLPGTRLRDAVVNSNPYFKRMVESDFVADISGGDSFSDIYGMRRFIMRFLCKWLIIQMGKEIILLPQTYGPFKRHMAKLIGRYVLKHASVVFTRDHNGVEYVRDFLNNPSVNGKIRFAPDVAFVLDSHESENIDVGSLKNARTADAVVVGLNVSGLLFNGGYTKDNMFGLRTGYRQVIYSIIDLLMKSERVLVLLVPHVFGPTGSVESDRDACLQVYNALNIKYKERIFMAGGEYNHNGIKYIIGMCNLFIGSRMHACIAAMSQCIPAIGLAYSKKYQGVFQSIGTEKLVIDMRQKRLGEILDTITEVFEERKVITEHLKKVVPEVQKTVLNIFSEIH